MKPMTVAAILAVSIAAGPAFAASKKSDEKLDKKALEANCMRWAKETKVPQDKLQEYVKFCMIDQMVPEKSSGGGDGE